MVGLIFETFENLQHTKIYKKQNTLKSSIMKNLNHIMNVGVNPRPWAICFAYGKDDTSITGFKE